MGVAPNMNIQYTSIMSINECGNPTELMTLSNMELVSKFLKMEKMLKKTLEENYGLRNKIKYLEELSSLPTSNEWKQNHTEEEMELRKKIDKRICDVTEHDTKCNAEFGLKEGEVESSQAQFNWRVVDLFDNNKKWLSWDTMCQPPKEEEKDGVEWLYGARLDHAFTGILRIKGGNSQPCHRHKLPEIYYILQGSPVVTLAGIPNRVRKWQCVSIPSYCPHTITNDGEEEAIIAWCYLSPEDKVNPHENYDWKWLQKNDASRESMDVLPKDRKLVEPSPFFLKTYKVI